MHTQRRTACELTSQPGLLAHQALCTHTQSVLSEQRQTSALRPGPSRSHEQHGATNEARRVGKLPTWNSSKSSSRLPSTSKRSKSSPRFLDPSLPYAAALSRWTARSIRSLHSHSICQNMSLHHTRLQIACGLTPSGRHLFCQTILFPVCSVGTRSASLAES